MTQAGVPARFAPGPDPEMVAFARKMRGDFSKFLMEYQFAVDEVLTKVSILRQEFVHLHDYNPIEHVTSRIKKVESILEKVARRGCTPALDEVRAQITDIAGIRITCSFLADTYRVLETITAQDDVTVLAIKDYIKNPKPNGYKSLHAIIEIPVFLSTGPVPVPVELQIRTIAQDFWASLEHKIYYKFDRAVPDHLAGELAATAAVAEQLDRRMEELHTEVHGTRNAASDATSPVEVLDDAVLRRLWELSHQQR